MAMASPERSALAVLVGLLALAPPARAQSAADLETTKHNLSTSGTGTVRAQNESRICIFCHTPHNGTLQSPLWNKALDPQVYTLYTSPTLQAGPLSQPSGATKLCLSCHDGTIAMGAVLNPSGGIAMAGTGLFPPGSLSEFGLDLSSHHPVSFSYSAALPNPELAGTPPSHLTYGSSDEVHCTTCHDPHKDVYGKFLVEDHRNSALCVECHQIPGWTGSKHDVSTVSVAGILPRPPKTYPTWTQLGEWGCETCHTPHFAPTAEQLLNFTANPPAFDCTTSGCHSGPPPPQHRPGGRAMADIGKQTQKVSAHPEVAGISGGRSRSARSAGCSDCHDPHKVTDRPAQAPDVSGLLQGVPGVDRHGSPVEPARYEYEICFRCHADNNPGLETVPRVVASTNTRLEFDPGNASFHPVVSAGREVNVPSIPSTFEPALRPTSSIFCTSCHADDEGGSRGPHGSVFAPILKERYEMADGAVEGQETFALCYRCHDRASILRDTSFRKKTLRSTPSGGGHSGHLAANVPCSACHDPHGVPVEGGSFTKDPTGSHTHLINFDRRIVQPRPGAQYPVFLDTGTFSGSCALVCHGVTHDPATAVYP
jgi:predicted CXXCH cytochrome family protein